jgi:hypothetical protein
MVAATRARALTEFALPAPKSLRHSGIGDKRALHQSLNNPVAFEAANPRLTPGFKTPATINIRVWLVPVRIQYRA